MTGQYFDEDKRQRIIWASRIEFAKGFEKASTNKIVERAGISKGLLFHYFGSKEKLFLYVLNHYMEEVTDKFHQGVDEITGNFFDRLIKVAVRQVEYYRQDPLSFQFLMGAFNNPPSSLKVEMAAIQQRMYERNYVAFFGKLDQSCFRADVDPHRALALIEMVLASLRRKHIHNPNTDLDIAAVLQEYSEYMDLLKKGICKPGV